jgi:hypothetical protein
VYLKNSDSNKLWCEQDKYVNYMNVEGGGENGDDSSPASLDNNRVSKYTGLFYSPSDGNNTRFW